MAKKTVEKTRMKSNKWKNENVNVRRSTRASEIKPSADGFRSSLPSKRTSPRSIKTVLPPKEKSGSKDSAKKKEKKKKLPMTPTSQQSSHTNINLATPPNNSRNNSCVSVNSPTSKHNKPVKKAYVVFVGNLPYAVTKEQLEEHFRKTGGVKKIRIPKEKGTDRGRGFAYIEFKDRISHKIGLRLHHTHLGGRQINVEFTSIGGKNPKRLEKLKQKNLKLKNMRKDFCPS
ncbi:NOP6 [Acanthosepion pharaonis]|uniref:NOP6 n=1 Tax=Acanthosepion pharaonis TaxID=158019 RepID=A0A812DUI7_ACAPH|nr:NOP6 [Sepia pharaonis]